MGISSSRGSLLRVLASLGLVLGVVAIPGAGADAGFTLAPPIFEKSFAPDTIGPGSSSALTFVIDNTSNGIREDLEFTDVLPAGVTIATPSSAATTCPSGTLTAPDGGTTITFADGTVGAGQLCTVTVNVTAGAVDSSDTTYTNTSGPLTYLGGGAAGPATADLDVDVDRPGFTKDFAPDPIDLGERSTLTFTIDNSLNPSAVTSFFFQDALPVGLVVAGPTNATTTCAGLPEPVFGAIGDNAPLVPGSTSFRFSNGSVGADDTCTVSVDVIGTAEGSLGNVSGDLDATVGATSRNAGFATATIDVVRSDLHVSKAFLDDPIAAGGTATLEIRIDNFDRDFPATAVAVSDTLPGGVTLATPAGASTDCGGTLIAVDGTDTISLSGGTIAAQSSCTITASVTTDVAGVYTNTTEAVTGTVDGESIVGNTATEDLFVNPGPIFTKEFIGDPVGAGGTVTLEFTITNGNPEAPLTDLAFTDLLWSDVDGGVLPGLAANELVAPDGLEPDPLVDPCGAGSLLTIPDPNDTLPTPPFPAFPPDPGQLVFTGGSLAAAGSPGDSCTFSVTLDVPAGSADGVFTNTTTPITGDDCGECFFTGGAASDDLVVVGGVTLAKEFVDDPVVAGADLTLEFTISNPSDTNSATGIAFTDDLTFLTDLTATVPPVPDPPCGVGSSLTASAADTLLTFAGGTLGPGETCAFTVALTVPTDAPLGVHTNVTSGVSALVSDVATVGAPAEDDLTVSPLSFTKEFTDDPVAPGGIVTLEFTIGLDASSPTPATGINYRDPLDVTDPDLTTSGLPLTEACDPDGAGGDTGTGTLSESAGDLVFTGGSLDAGETCTFSVELGVPAGVPAGSYTSATQLDETNPAGIAATIDGGTVLGPKASDTLEVAVPLPPLLTKEFTDDPVLPGGSVTLEFTIQNPNGSAIESIAFSDDLDATLTGLLATGLPIAACGGTLSTADGGQTIDLVGGTLGPDQTCTFSLVLSVPAGDASLGLHLNTTTEITAAIPDVTPLTGDPATDSLIVQGVEFTKEFDGPTTAGGTADLTFTITNLDDGAPVDGLGFLDDLDAVIPGLEATTLPATPCGTGSTITGTSSLTFADGSLDAAGSCSFTVTVTVPDTATAGTFPNTTSDLESNGQFIASPATADLTIEPPPTFAKAFAPDTIAPGGVSTLTFTIDNGASALDANEFSFVDTFPAGVVLADPPGASTTCGGMGDATAGASSFTFGGGTVGAGESCTISLDVTSAVPGAYVNTTDDFTSSSGNSGTATDTLTVTALVPPTFSKAFSPDSIVTTSTSTLTFTIDNSASLLDAADVLLDDDFPSGLVIADPPNASSTCAAGTGDAVAGNPDFVFSGGLVAAGATCTISVDVASATEGSYVNTTADLLSTLGNSGTATATLIVDDGPTVTINQSAGQADPTNASPINFTVVFNEAVTGFEAGDVSVTNGSVASVSPATGAGRQFTVAVTPADQGIVSATVPAGGAIDSGGNTNAASTSTDNEVNYDSIDPVINTPSITVNNDPGEPGAIVDYVVTTTDEGTTTGLQVSLAPNSLFAALVPAGGLTCTPPSGSFFPIGTTTVSCSATDLAGNASAKTFDVVVVDNEDPTIAAAPDVEQVVTAVRNVTVVFSDPAASDNSGEVTVTCTPASGSMFAIGDTVVTCTAEDPSGNTASTTFTVTVSNNDDLLPATGGGLNVLGIALQLSVAGLVLLAIRSFGRRRPSLG